jgi:cellulose biosynthesis protein BcsQ
MINTIWNFPGGVGKTSIAAEIALEQNCQVITNDVVTPLSLILPEESLYRLQWGEEMPQVPTDVNLLFDLGGYPDERGISALKQSKYVVIPTIMETGRMSITLDAIAEIQKYNDRILIVANRIDPHNKELDAIQEVIHHHYSHLPILPLKESRAFPNILIEKKSIHEMVKEGGTKRYHYQKVVEQLDKIIDFIKE